MRGKSVRSKSSKGRKNLGGSDGGEAGGEGDAFGECDLGGCLRGSDI